MNITKCTSCSAPLPKNKTICTYCNTRNMVDIQGYGSYNSAQAQELRQCPGCKTEMKTIDVANGKIGNDQFIIDKCPKCHGLFFDNEELHQLLENKTAKVNYVNNGRLTEISETRPEINITYRPCPICKSLMNRTNFGARSGIVIDQCREHGIYLDSGELRQLLEWRKAGGHIADERSSKQARKEKIVKKAAEIKISRHRQRLNSNSSSSATEYGSTFTSNFIDMLYRTFS
ncbi:MAG: zf-TFIIB domain-containing protein [Desulfotalea sp.]